MAKCHRSITDLNVPLSSKTYITLVQKAQVTELQKFTQHRRVLEALAYLQGAFLGAVEVGDQLLQEIAAHLYFAD